MIPKIKINYLCRKINLITKVYCLLQCDAYEGCTLEQIFSNKQNAINFVKQNHKEFTKMKYDGLKIKFSKKNDPYSVIYIEEWEVT